MGGIRPPKPLLVSSELDMAQEWTEWLEQYGNYFIASKIDQETPQVRKANFMAIVGRDTMKIVNNIEMTVTERADLDTVIEKLTAYFSPARNKTYERCQFHRIKQQQHEGFEDFLQKLQTHVKRCSYGTNADEFVMDQIVLGIHSDSTRQRLWTEDQLNLEKTIKICRAAERANKQINELQNVPSTSTAVNAVATNDKKYKCSRCGNMHGKKQCPAYKKKCGKCERTGHFDKMCRSKSSKNPKSDKKVNAVQRDTDSDASENTEEYRVGAVTENWNDNFPIHDKWSEKLKIGDDYLIVK